MSNYISITEARESSGLRMACLAGVPSPWTEAAKGVFRIKNLDCQLAVQGERDPENAIAEWAGDSSIPVVAYENEKLRTGWAEILILAERLAPEPALIPSDAGLRAEMFGLSHEICGEMGLGWAYRLMMVQVSLSHAEGEGFPAPVANFLAGKYGFFPEHARIAKERVLAVLDMLGKRLSGNRYLVGDTLSAADVYWATFANLFLILDETDMPGVVPMIRAAYTCHDDDVLNAVTDELRNHQHFVYEQHIGLPAPV